MLKQVVFSCTLFFTVILIPLGQAEPLIDDPLIGDAELLAQQRELFVKAEYAASRGRLPEYQLLLQQLGDYPLAPYLELKRLQQVGYLSNEERVLNFLDSYKNTPMDWQLRQVWLTYLARNDEKARFVRDFSPPGSIANQCLNYRYQLDLELTPTDAIYRAVDHLWQNGDSLPKACDPLLERWQQAGHRTDELIWARLKLAAEGGNHTLIPYLGRLLPESMGYLADHYHRVRRDPANVRHMHYFTGAFPEHEAEIVTYGLSRLIWRDPDRAVGLLQNLPATINLTADQRTYLYQRFGVALSSKNHPGADEWLAKLAPEEHNDQSLQWQLASWVRTGNWQALIEFVPRMPVVTQQYSVWQYWLARAYAETGNEELARPIFQALARERHYYGFLAAARLGQPHSLAREAINYEPADIAALRERADIRRTYEFLQLGRYLSARREWNQLLPKLDGKEQQLAAVLAHQWGWYDQAIFTLGQLGEYDAVSVRFPQAYRSDHESYAERVGIDPNWAFAISRRESAFRFDAHSPAGAHGLMQIMPRTAEYLERKPMSNQQLQHVPTNIRLGTSYLAELRGRLGNNWVLATAAYNGGIYRVYEWLPEEPLAVDRWIETIPFRETRDYVKNVLAYQQIYRDLRDDETPVFAELIPMEISRKAAGR